MRILLVVMVVVGMMGKGARGAGMETAGVDGVWLLKDAQSNGRRSVNWGWDSVLTVKEGRFVCTHFRGVSASLTGRVVMDVGRKKGAVDLETDGIDMSEEWEGVTYGKSRVAGIYEVAGDEMRVCVRLGEGLARPVEFVSWDDDTLMMTLERAGAGFKELPKEVELRVVDGAGKGVSGAKLFLSMGRIENLTNVGTNPAWKYFDAGKADEAGVLRLPCETFMNGTVVGARDASGTMVGLTMLSPAMLQEGKAEIRLEHECVVTGRVTCPALEKAGKPMAYTYVYVRKDGQSVAAYSGFSGEFYLRVPPGEYTFLVAGDDFETKSRELTVPAGVGAMEVPVTEMEYTKLAGLRGKVVPELEHVLAWKGEGVKLSALRGKVVLLNFWGYWCPSCVTEMPWVMAAEKKFGKDGVVVVGVHGDMEGEVDTAAKLEEKTAKIREKFWGGRDVDFPVAIVSGKKGEGVERAADVYGVKYWPTTIVIDRMGKVVGTLPVCEDEKGFLEAVGKMVER